MRSCSATSGYPPELLSGSLLPWEGIAEVVELLRLPASAGFWARRVPGSGTDRAQIAR
jgi:hypothetical protein